MKKLFKLLLALILLLVAAVLLSPLWIGPVVCSVANQVVPAKTRTPFHLGAFQLNGYTGRIALGEMQLENPDGFEQRQAVTLNSLKVDVDTSTIFSDTIVIRNVELDGLFVAYVNDPIGRNNFKVIMSNVQGDAQPESSPQAQAPSPRAQTPSQRAQAQTPSPKAQAQTPSPAERPRRKVIIDRVSVAGVRVQFGQLTLPVPSLTLTGIGRKSNGVLLQDAYQEIFGKVTASLGILGDGLKGLKVPESIKGVSDEANRILQTANEGVSKANETLQTTRQQAGRAVETFKSVGSSAGSAVESAGSAVKSVGESAGSAVKSVGEGAEKATKLIKGLFD